MLNLKPQRFRGERCIRWFGDQSVHLSNISGLLSHNLAAAASLTTARTLQLSLPFASLRPGVLALNPCPIKTQCRKDAKSQSITARLPPNARTERQPPRRDNARDSRQPERAAEARDSRTAKRGGCSLQ
jgi:hypothetical protein